KDSHAKVQMRKKVRGLRDIERQVLEDRRQQEPQAELTSPASARPASARPAAASAPVARAVTASEPVAVGAQASSEVVAGEPTASPAAAGLVANVRDVNA